MQPTPRKARLKADVRRIVSSKPPQYRIEKEWLYYFYRQVILPWEIDWKSSKFLIERGSLRDFCEQDNFSIKSFASAKELEYAMKEYDDCIRLNRGALWFVRREQKPKDVLRHLRNAFAHGHFSKRQKNNTMCVDISCIDNKILKARGFVPLKSLKRMVNAAWSCKC